MSRCLREKTLTKDKILYVTTCASGLPTEDAKTYCSRHKTREAAIRQAKRFDLEEKENYHDEFLS